MNLLDLMLDLKITRVSQAKENVVFFLKDQLDILVMKLFSFDMKENECKKEAPPPLLASLDKWSRKPPHNEDKARCGGCDFHTNIIFGASLIKIKLKLVFKRTLQ